MAKTIGVFQLLQKEFSVYDFDGRWAESLGNPAKNFTAIIYGDSGNGKTSFCVQFAKYLTRFTKVLYVSQEEGISATMKRAFTLHKMNEVAGRIVLGEKFTTEDLIKYCKKRNSPQVIFIDSVDRMRLKYEEFLAIVTACPKKSFVFIAWSKGKEPNSATAKKIEYDVDIKIHVHQWKAYPRSRYGGNTPFVIWDKPAAIQPTPPPEPTTENESKTPIKTDNNESATNDQEILEEAGG